jgi:hypothetical protein
MYLDFCAMHHHRAQKSPILLLLLSAITLITLQGCGTLSNGHKWGGDATLSPGWDRIKTSAVSAALSPETWAPVAGALALQISNMDHHISNWASDKHPIFGSGKNAGNWSDYLELSSGVVYLATVMATPSGDDTSEWLTAKAKGFSVGLAVSGITSGTTTMIKSISGRKRPSGGSEASFPSGHESGTAALTTLAMRNLDSMSLSQESRLFADIGIAGIAVGTGWGRIEAKAHYPSDVLVGYALGHFFSAFINDAFLGLDNKKSPMITMEPSRKGMYVGLNWTF